MGIVGTASAAPRQAVPQSRPAAEAKKTKSLLGGGFKDAKVRGNRGNYLAPINENEAATYVVRINRCQLLAKAESFNEKETFIVEGEVVESNAAACPAGYIFSWVTHEGMWYYQEDVKGFLCAAFGLPPEDGEKVDEDDVLAATGEEQAAAGKLAKVLVKNKKTKANTDFTQHMWSVATA